MLLRLLVGVSLLSGIPVEYARADQCKKALATLVAQNVASERSVPVHELSNIPRLSNNRIPLSALPLDPSERVLLHVDAKTGHFKLIIDELSFDGRLMKSPVVSTNIGSISDGFIVTFPNLGEQQIHALRTAINEATHEGKEGKRYLQQRHWTCVDAACHMLREYAGLEINNGGRGREFFSPDALRSIVENGFRNVQTGNSEPTKIYSTIAQELEQYLQKLETVSVKRYWIRIKQGGYLLLALTAAGTLIGVTQ